MSRRTLFVGDVHGCAWELGRLLKETRPKRVVLLGDLFTRGPDPVGVWKLVKRWGAEAVLGNHDVTVVERWTPGDKLPKKAHRWLQDLPLMIKGDGWLAVHAGIRPEGRKHTSRQDALFISECRVKGRGRDWWWELYRGKRLVLYGHHAYRGLNDRRPHTLGLDSGCVWGGALSGYLLEDDEIVQVQARRRYWG